MQSVGRSNSSLTEIRRAIAEITDKSAKSDVHLSLARKMNVNASLTLSSGRANFAPLRTSWTALVHRTESCNVKLSETNRLIPELQSEYVFPAQRHADDLWRQAQALFKWVVLSRATTWWI